MKYILILLFLSSCSCAYHVKQATKKGCIKYENDTIVKYDTLRGFKIDTVVQFHNEVDTLLIDSGGIKSVVVIRWKDKIVSQTIAKKDTVIKTVSVNHNTKVEIPVKFTPWWVWGLIILLTLGLVFKK